MVGLLLGALITQRRLDAEGHRHASLHDPLTGLANRSLFTDRLTHVLARATRHPEHSSAVMFLDLDRFRPSTTASGTPPGTKSWWRSPDG